jgi:hypothetical protein
MSKKKENNLKITKCKNFTDMIEKQCPLSKGKYKVVN